MRVCIIGAGNIGTYLAAYIGKNKEHEVVLHTSKKENVSKSIELIEEEIGVTTTVKLYDVVDSYKEGVKEADLTLVTYPSFIVGQALEEISKWIKEGSIIGVIPGFGGAEFYSEKFLEKGCIFFGSQRVPSITRLKEYGKSVCLREKNPFMNIAGFPKQDINRVADMMTDLIDIKTNKLEDYLAITLSPSNPVMHPSRLYELFKDYKEGVLYDEHSLFYEGWGDVASSCLLELDEELLKVTLGIIGETTEEFERIKSRFRIEEPSELTEKIRTAVGFLGIKTPMLEVEGGWIPDLSSRYFIEDIEFGTCIIKGFAELLNIETPKIDEIILWGQNLLNKEYLVEGSLKGRDTEELLIPKNLGFKNREDIIKFYNR